jgi:lipopolysaccharide biosynthesis protein
MSNAIENVETPANRQSDFVRSAVKAIAFHLPQFHPIPENDQWWGKGFTEWRNVANAKKQFPWHNQPHLPADLGFYDLRLAEAREGQADLAREYGIHGFCYYHYWFNGRRLLERPVDAILDSGAPDFPFCLCWANENWTRAWDGAEREVLIGQNYSREDDREHLHWLCRAFEDSRYIRVNGKPLFLVYRASRLPDARQTAETWREEARRNGVGEIMLANVESFATEQRDPETIGFDVAVEFAPDWSRLGAPLQRTFSSRVLRKLRLASPNYVKHRVFDYADVAERMLAKERPPYIRFPGVTPMWDNAARRQQGATILKGSTPALYQSWLSRAIEKFLPRESGHELVFINAWNEWAEGNHLEPCQEWGRAYLEATSAALAAAGRPKG